MPHRRLRDRINRDGLRTLGLPTAPQSPLEPPTAPKPRRTGQNARSAPPLSEKRFLAQVVGLAMLRGWRHYHTHRSEGSAAGFPDLVLVRRPRVVWAELKRDSGRLTRAQQDWLSDLAACGQEWYVWRPADWEEIVEVLSRDA